MKIADIVQKLLGIEQRLDAADKTKATLTSETLATLKTDFEATKKDVDGKLTQALSDLETSKASLKSEIEAKGAILSALDAACTAVKIEGGDATKIAAMTPAAKITALQTSVSDTLAKLHVEPSKIPAAGAKAAEQSATTMTLEAFRALNPGQKQSFLKSGGTLVD